MHVTYCEYGHSLGSLSWWTRRRLWRTQKRTFFPLCWEVQGQLSWRTPQPIGVQTWPGCTAGIYTYIAVCLGLNLDVCGLLITAIAMKFNTFCAGQSLLPLGESSSCIHCPRGQWTAVPEWQYICLPKWAGNSLHLPKSLGSPRQLHVGANNQGKYCG